MTERQRRDLGEIRLEMLEAAGYVWRATPPEGFWHARKGDGFWHASKGDLIRYDEALDATFAELGQRIAAGSR
jgi:hypothetical protein